MPLTKGEEGISLRMGVLKIIIYIPCYTLNELIDQSVYEDVKDVMIHALGEMVRNEYH